jgi:hypothetical protein
VGDANEADTAGVADVTLATKETEVETVGITLALKF